MYNSLIVPAYNEEKRLVPFLDLVSSHYLHNPADFDELVFVDDGSTDKTSLVAQQYAKHLPIKVIKHEVNKGKGAAVRTGIMAARGDMIIFIDADGATPITELPKMLDALKDHDIGIGNRWLPNSKTQRHSLLRKFAGFVYRQYMSLFGLGSIDTMCGFKGFRRPVALQLFSNLQEERWLFDTEIIYKAVQAKYSIKNFPISWESKKGSKLDAASLLKSAFDVWPLIRRIKNQPTSQTLAK